MPTKFRAICTSGLRDASERGGGGGGGGRVVHVLWAFGVLWHCWREPLWDTRKLARSFLAKLDVVGAGVE